MHSTAGRRQRPRAEPALPLFDQPPPANASATSQAAVAAIAEHAPGQRQRVLDALIAAGEHGATNEELAELLAMRMSSVAARRNELVRAGLARETPRSRPTSSGRSAAVVVATVPAEA